MPILDVSADRLHRMLGRGHTKRDQELEKFVDHERARMDTKSRPYYWTRMRTSDRQLGVHRSNDSYITEGSFWSR